MDYFASVTLSGSRVELIPMSMDHVEGLAAVGGDPRIGVGCRHRTTSRAA